MKTIYATLILLMTMSISGTCQDETKKAEDYFTVFLNKNGSDLIEVFTMHQPTLADCKIMFKDDFYKDAFKGINEMFVNLLEQTETQNNRFKNKTVCRATKFNSSDVSECPGAVKRVAEHFNKGITCYKLEFLENKDSESGSSYYFFTIINYRWVYFPMN